jgi:hypothetical protein
MWRYGQIRVGGDPGLSKLSDESNDEIDSLAIGVRFWHVVTQD